MFVAVQQLDAQSGEQFRVVAAAVAAAQSEHDILTAIASYAQRTGATDLGLMHINLGGNGEPGEAVFVASIGPHSNPAAIGAALPLDQLPMFVLDQDEPGAIVIFEDYQNDPRFDAAARERARAMHIGAGIILPLMNAGHLQGAIMILWETVHRLTRQEHDTYTHVFPLVASAFSRLRVYRVEQELRQERELFFEASAAINEANSYAEIVRAVEGLRLTEGDVHLTLVRRDERSSDFYYEVVAASDNQFKVTGLRLDRGSLPIFEQYESSTVYVMEDVQAYLQLDDINRAWLTQLGIRFTAGYPLRLGERVLGALSLADRQPRYFSLRDRRIFEALGRLVAAAVGRILSQEQTQEAEREAAFLYRLAQEINSARDFQDVADVVLRANEELEGVYLQIWEGLDFDTGAFYDVAGAAVRGDKLQPDRGTRYYKAELQEYYERVRRERFWLIEDTFADRRVTPVTKATYARLNVRASLVITLQKAGQWLASLSFRYSQPHSFSQRERRLFSGIGDVVLAAVERIASQETTTRAYRAEQEAREETEALYRVSEEINAANSFHEIVRAVAKLDFGPGDIYLNLFENYNYEGARYFDIVATATDAFDHEGERWWISEFSLVHRFPRQGVFINENIPENPNIDEESKKQFLRLGVQSNMRVSLSLRGRWMGGLGLDSAMPRSYTEREKRLMAGVGDLVAAAVERIRLQQETIAALEETRRLNEQIQRLTAIEERNRLARELHDSVSQALYGIGLGARTAQKMWNKDHDTVRESIDYIVSLAEAGLVEMRALIFELRPESLENEGLVTALAKQGASLQARHGLNVQLELCEEPALTLETKESLYRIAREALHNIIKHAGATQVILRMQHLDDRLVMQIIDNGVGFDTDQEFPGHLGLKSMQERIGYMGGEIELRSAPGQGTQLTVKL